MGDIAQLLYNTKGMIWQHAICHAICQAMKAAGICQEKLCKSGCIFRPRPRWRASGRQRNASTAYSLRWPDCGAPCSSSLNQRPLRVACCGPARGCISSGHIRVASRLSAASIGLWQDGPRRQPSQRIRGRCTACTWWRSAQ